LQRADELSKILDTIWVVVVSVMIILSQTGFIMKETGSIKMIKNSAVLLKTILVVSVSSLTFFIVGFGFSIDAEGGLLGQDHFFGTNYNYHHYTNFVFYIALCVMMATIATGSIAERTHTDTYIFFSFITSGFIFPLGLAWCWNDGWLQNVGFQDYGGAAIVHLMGGVAGFIGTYLLGPRLGLFQQDTRLAYVLEDKLVGDDEGN
jgi:ammonium transporter, Amt family